MGNFDIPDAPWIGLCKEEWEEICNPCSDREKQEEYEAEEADRLWKEKQLERMKNDG